MSAHTPAAVLGQFIAARTSLDLPEAEAAVVAVLEERLDLLQSLEALVRGAAGGLDESRRWHYDAHNNRVEKFRSSCPLCVARTAIAEARGGQ